MDVSNLKAGSVCGGSGTRGKTDWLLSQQNSTKKSGEDYFACKSQPVSREATEKQQASGEPKLPRPSVNGTKQKRSMKEDKEKTAQDNARVRIRKKIPIPPLPSMLPPVNLLHRDVVRAWCQQLKLSTKGQKLDAYRRLCEFAYPNQMKNIPLTAKEAKILTPSQKRSKMDKGEMFLENSKKKSSSHGTHPPEVAAPPEGGMQALVGSDPLPEGVETVVVTTSAPDAVFASWSRIASTAGKMETVESTQDAYGVRWCVVHGKSLPADTEGWVRLQFHAGQAWVPEKQGRVCALFLLPACNFPPPHLEDNMLCPKCVRRNKVLMKSLQ
ncbi:developmental pluripotency-associated protein 4 isoform X1 [Felis catus]|uniref:developmental pluripotency-associated protein 4 isoform X1 n=2 Tax=Felis catus TaxID=9685 RepID=UPI001D198C12|nr:developmental pluripotency-associated protein 4 isoform X1 [Felis catus]